MHALQRCFVGDSRTPSAWLREATLRIRPIEKGPATTKCRSGNHQVRTREKVRYTPTRAVLPLLKMEIDGRG